MRPIQKGRKMKQTNLFEEITVDGFCGGGGWSTGFELGICRPVDIGINHDAAAIALHKKNHPYTKHYQCNIFEVDPVEACQGRPVGWAHFSPDCKHFSRAKGAKPVSKKIRSLAWVVVQWAAAVHPRIISMENVPEFLTWGPCIAMRGQHGRLLKRINVMLNGKELEQTVEAAPGENVPHDQRVLTPDPKRKGKTFGQFVGHLRKLGYEVEWRELTASDYGAPTSRKRFFLLARRDKKPIVWPEATHGDPKSIAVQNGDLKPWRTAAEIIDWTLPCPSIFERKKPLAENTLKRIAKGLQKFVLDNPEPFIVQVNHSGDNFRGQSLDVPMPTVTSKHGFGVVTPYVVGICQQGGGDRVRGANEPLSTICTKNEHCVVTPYIMCNNAENLGRNIQDPVPTITTGNRNFLMAPTLIQYHTEQSAREHRGQVVEMPLQTVDAANRYGLATAFISKYYGDGEQGTGSKMDAPLGTITAIDHNSIAAATLIQFNNHCDGVDVQKPLPTITAQSNHFAEVRAMLIKYYGCGVGQPVTQPLDTITARDRFGLVTVRGVDYQIVDIGLRMLTPRELYNAQGFPPDYEIEVDCYGRAYPKKEQVARCGNAVPPAFATALVRANWPEACGPEIDTMAQFNDAVAV
jgi:DNA (cytosine-5)-methyltransferase 1